MSKVLGDAPAGALLQAQLSWVTEKRGCLMAMAALMALPTCKFSLYPPVMMRDNFPGSYAYFRVFNNTALVTSLLLAVLVSSEVFYRTRARMTALIIITVVHVACLFAAHTIGTSPDDPLAGSFALLGGVIVCGLMYLVAYIGVAVRKLLR